MMLRLEKRLQDYHLFFVQMLSFHLLFTEKGDRAACYPFNSSNQYTHESFRIVSRNFVWSQSTFMLPFQFTVKTERAGSSLNFIFLEADIKLLTRDWRTAKIYFYVHRLMCEE